MKKQRAPLPVYAQRQPQNFRKLARRYKVWSEHESVRRVYGDFQTYSGDFGTKGIIGLLDFIFTPIANDPTVKASLVCSNSST